MHRAPDRQSWVSLTHPCLLLRWLTLSGITEAFKADKFGEKINLGVGAYRESPRRTTAHELKDVTRR